MTPSRKCTLCGQDMKSLAQIQCWGCVRVCNKLKVQIRYPNEKIHPQALRLYEAGFPLDRFTPYLYEFTTKCIGWKVVESAQHKKEREEEVERQRKEQEAAEQRRAELDVAWRRMEQERKERERKENIYKGIRNVKFDEACRLDGWDYDYQRPRPCSSKGIPIYSESGQFFHGYRKDPSPGEEWNY